MQGSDRSANVSEIRAATRSDIDALLLLVKQYWRFEAIELTAEVDELFVASKYRGAGIGARLLSVAEQAFRDAGCTRVFLQIGRGNEEARAFYRAHGFGDRAGFELIDKALT